MEQNLNQQSTVYVQPKKSTGVQTAAFVIGILGVVFGMLAYFATIGGNVLTMILWDQGTLDSVSIPSWIWITCDIILAILCLVGLIIGLIGLVKSIKRETRTVKGIVFSAIGMNLSAAGLILMIIGLVISGMFKVIMLTGM